MLLAGKVQTRRGGAWISKPSQLPHRQAHDMRRETGVDYRETAFRAKFDDAAKQLGVAADQIVSLKVREEFPPCHEYPRLLAALQTDAQLDCSSVSGDYQGRSHLVGNAKTSIIVVEHETGLEILYVAGSVASIIGLVPVVLRCWTAIRGHLGGRRHPDFRTVEIRRIDSGGHLLEERNHSMGLPWSEPLDIANQALLSAAENIDGEIQQVKASLQSLTNRMNAVEEKLAEKTPQTSVRPRRSTTKRKPKKG